MNHFKQTVLISGLKTFCISFCFICLINQTFYVLCQFKKFGFNIIFLILAIYLQLWFYVFIKITKFCITHYSRFNKFFFCASEKLKNKIALKKYFG